MKNKYQITSALGSVDEKYLLEALPCKRKKAREFTINSRQIAAVAACVIVCFGTWLSVLKWGTRVGGGDHILTDDTNPSDTIGSETEPNAALDDAFDNVTKIEIEYGGNTVTATNTDVICNVMNKIKKCDLVYMKSSDAYIEVGTISYGDVPFDIPLDRNIYYYMAFWKPPTYNVSIYNGDNKLSELSINDTTRLCFSNSAYAYSSNFAKIEHSQTQNELTAYLSFICNGRQCYEEAVETGVGEMWQFSITFEDGEFTYSPGIVSSYCGHGTFDIKDGMLIATDDFSENSTGCFRIEEDGLVFLKESSTGRFATELADGQVLYLK